MFGGGSGPISKSPQESRGPSNPPKKWQYNLSHPKASTLIPRMVMIPSHPKYPLISSFASCPMCASHGESSSLKDISTLVIYIYSESETNPPIFVPIDFLKQNANWNS